MKKKIFGKLKYVLSGLAIGVINGFFGGGGGMVCVPILENALKLDNKRSHATALAVMFPFCIASGIVYLTDRSNILKRFATVLSCQAVRLRFIIRPSAEIVLRF